MMPTTEANTANPGGWRLAPSIAARLTFLFVLSAAGLLVLSALIHYFTLESSLAARDRAAISGKINVLRLLLRSEKDQSALLVSEVEHEAVENSLTPYFLRILDGSGQVIIETTGMKELVRNRDFPGPDEPARRYVVLDQARDRVFLLEAARAASADARYPDYVIQAAFDITSHEELLLGFRQRMLLALVIGVVLAAGLGVVVARYALRPLKAIARSLRRITASRLDERLQEARWPSELHDLARSCDAMLDRLQASFDRLSQFSADLAHELRTPIGNLRGETEVTLSRLRTPEEYQHALVSSLEEFDRLSRMIDGLLFLARAEQPHAALERTMIHAGREMEAVREFFEALAADRQVSVACSGDVEMFGDAMLVRRALSNLLSNALHHTQPGGRVELWAVACEGGGVEIAVRDSGSGIAAEHLPRIFDRFYRVERSRRESAQGSGLGLAIVQSIMHLHGGEAVIESVRMAGTTVILRFPPAPAGSPRVL